MCFFECYCDDDVFVGCEVVGFYDDWCVFCVDVCVGGGCIGEGFVVGGWNVVVFYECFCEIF